MNFRTELTPNASAWHIGYDSHLLALGSCFAERIGERLRESRFSVLQNPFGVIFHPLPMLELWQRALHAQPLPPESIIFQEEMWRSFLLHSRHAAPTESELHATWAETTAQVRHTLAQKKPVVMLTFGTAVGYEHLETGRIVANNHRLPAAAFRRGLSPLAELTAAYQAFFEDFLPKNPSLRVLLTVSPVRHTRETLPLNGASKATLRLLCHTLAEKYPQQVAYFPAYELLMDDLRDYRFYADDLVHPSPMAEAYIWQKFSQTYFLPDTQELLRQWQEVRKALGHRPLHPESAATRLHQQQLQEKLAQLEARFRQ